MDRCTAARPDRAVGEAMRDMRRTGQQVGGAALPVKGQPVPSTGSTLTAGVDSKRPRSVALASGVRLGTSGMVARRGGVSDSSSSDKSLLERGQRLRQGLQLAERVGAAER